MTSVGATQPHLEEEDGDNDCDAGGDEDDEDDDDDPASGGEVQPASQTEMGITGDTNKAQGASVEEGAEESQAETDRMDLGELNWL